MHQAPCISTSKAELEPKLYSVMISQPAGLISFPFNATPLPFTKRIRPSGCTAASSGSVKVPPASK